MCYCKDGMYDNTTAYCVLALAIVKGITNPDVAYDVFYKNMDVTKTYRTSTETIRQVVRLVKTYPGKTMEEIGKMIGRSRHTVRHAMVLAGLDTRKGWERVGNSGMPPTFFEDKREEIRRLHAEHPDWTNNRLSIVVGVCWRFVDRTLKKKEGKVYGN